jgi:hypothetical protein
MHDLSMIGKDITIIAKLPFVLFSLPYEAILTISNGGFSRGLRNSFDAIQSSYGKESELMAQLSKSGGAGRGMDMVDLSGNYHSTIDDINDITALSKFRQATKRVRDASLVVNRLIPTTDIFQRAARATNAEVFARYVDGLEDMIGTRTSQFGIDDKVILEFKDSFRYNNNGHLQKIDMKKWSTKKVDRFDEILFHMGQNQSLQSTIGSSPLYSRTSAVGRLVTTLVGYPMEQFNVHGVEGMRHMDTTTLTHSLAGFAGTYMGLQARYATLGKDIDEDQLIMYSILSIPPLAALSSVKSMTDPAVFSVLRDILAVVGLEN